MENLSKEASPIHTVFLQGWIRCVVVFICSTVPLDENIVVVFLKKAISYLLLTIMISIYLGTHLHFTVL